MGNLAGVIARRIRSEGPLTVAAFMAMALHDPEFGYYPRHDPLGATGDFITAPEISQIFGELIGAWCADSWHRMGRPDPVILAELGPGRGTLMVDLLRAAGTMPDFRQAVRLHLVEASPILRAEQQRRLSAAEPRFVSDVAELPDGPLLLVANEFLDALPIRQLVRGEPGWRERLVALDPDNRLVFADGADGAAAALLVPERLRQSPPGTLIEVCPAAAILAAVLGARFVTQPGAALFIDYGYSAPPGRSTLAAVRQHQAADALDEPGAADLSAHVDFTAFAAAARAAGAAVDGPVPQGRFLESLGAAARLAALSARASPARRAEQASGLARLIDPAQMGKLFKALALTSPGMPAPAGFA